MNPSTSEKIHLIVADWRTGNYTQRKLAQKYKVSNGFVAKYTKGVSHDTADLVSMGVEYQCGLRALDEQAVSSVSSVVDERTRHVEFFNNVTVKNISSMMKKINLDTPIMEHRLAQAAIKDGRETVLGKSPDTAIQINTQQPAITAIELIAP